MISPHDLNISLPSMPSIGKRKVICPKPPYVLAVIVGVKGTLDANTGMIVMADEMMAFKMASSLKNASPDIKKTYVLMPDDKIPDDVNMFFFMHHFDESRTREFIKDKPAWLWVHNPGHMQPMEIIRYKERYYTGVFHAGKIIAPQMGIRVLEHTLEDETVFRSSPDKDSMGVVFVGNASMHTNMVPCLLRMSKMDIPLSVYGGHWDQFGVPNKGRIPMDQAPHVLSRASVCIDSVSENHQREGMTSTRLFQVLACGSALITTTNPDIVPVDLHKHILFAKDHDDLINMTIDLLKNPMKRNALRHGSRESCMKYTMERKSRQLYKMMKEDLDKIKEPINV